MKNVSTHAAILSLVVGLAGTQTGYAKAQAQGDYPRLCEAATDVGNYHNDFLKSFVTLQQGEGGWLFRDHDLKLKFGPGRSGMQKLGELQQALKAKGTTLVMVPIPTRALVHPQALGEIDYNLSRSRRAYERYLNQLRGMDIIVPDLEKLVASDVDKPLFFARDHHWNSRGARAVARYTARAIQRTHDYESLEKQQFLSHYIDKDNNHGSLQRAAEILCEGGDATPRYPKESFKIYQTALAGEADLFGDEQAADIVLVGTSNSQGKLWYNFSGFLSQYTNLDVSNEAVSGGGYDGSLMQFLSSDAFKLQPPKYLVWEIPSYYTLGSMAFYEQVLQLLKEES